MLIDVSTNKTVSDAAAALLLAPGRSVDDAFARRVDRDGQTFSFFGEH
jgi:hypothetical protein